MPDSPKCPLTDDHGSVKLREYVDMRFDAADRATQAAILAAERATTKAESASERRFESVNEFRAALSDSQRLMLPRGEYDQIHSGLVERVNNLTERFNALTERGKGSHDLWLILVALAGVLTGAVSIIFSIYHMAGKM